jgi:DNA-binding transcriptional MerR regulator/effector-binding domain-containing protein
MTEIMKLKIGEFARLGQVTVQTLRYYADLGLLKPGEVDPFTGYRYYLIDQLPSLHRILALKDMSIPLEQIKRMLHENITPEEMRRILLLKQEEIRAQVQNSLDQLERINLRLQLLEPKSHPFNYEVQIKHVDPITIASVRGVVPNYSDVQPLWMELYQRMQQESIRSGNPYFAMCHSSEPEIHLEVCAPVLEPDKKLPGELVHTLPEVKTMAYTLHQGPFSGLIDGFTALFQWVNDNGFRINGPDREIYLRLPAGDKFDTDPNALTELQIPVVRAQC